MKTIDFPAWLKINYPDEDIDGFLCENCNGDIEYQCWECGETTNCDDCDNGVNKSLTDEEKDIFDEYKTQLHKDKKLFGNN